MTIQDYHDIATIIYDAQQDRPQTESMYDTGHEHGIISACSTIARELADLFEQHTTKDGEYRFVREEFIGTCDFGPLHLGNIEHLMDEKTSEK